MDLDNELYEKMSDILNEKIRSKYKTVKAFSEKIGLPYTTVHTILNRSLGGASIHAVLKICKELGLTLEELEKMAQGSTIIHDEITTIAAHHDDNNDFTEEELDEIENFKRYVLSKKKNKENN